MSECPGITEAQLKTTNGCGSSAWYAWIFRIPRWFSHEIWCACNKHDLSYQNLYTKALIFKFRADDDLVDAMYNSAFNGEPWQKWIKIFLAEVTRFALSTTISEWCWYRAKGGR